MLDLASCLLSDSKSFSSLESPVDAPVDDLRQLPRRIEEDPKDVRMDCRGILMNIRRPHTACRDSLCDQSTQSPRRFRNVLINQDE